MKWEATAAANPRASVDRGRYRVLIVDDNSNMRAILAEFLHLFDIEVAEAGDGWTAMAMFQGDHFDLVITDLQMPVMDGLTLMTRIKGLSDHTPVVVITGQCEAEIADTGVMTLANKVLFKPFDLNDLKTILDDAVYDRSNHRRVEA